MLTDTIVLGQVNRYNAVRFLNMMQYVNCTV